MCVTTFYCGIILWMHHLLVLHHIFIDQLYQLISVSILTHFFGFSFVISLHFVSFIKKYCNIWHFCYKTKETVIKTHCFYNTDVLFCK